MKRQSFSNHRMLLAALTLVVFALAASEQYVAAQNEMASVDDSRHDYYFEYQNKTRQSHKTQSSQHMAYAYLPADHLDIRTEPVKLASYPGGNVAYSQYIQENFQYPRSARENGFEGEVRASFYVNPDGSVSHIMIQKSISPELDAEVVRLISEMPKWDAAVYNSRKVRSRMVLPVEVKLK